MQGGRSARFVILLALMGGVIGSASARAQPVSGPHETVDNRLSTGQPNAPAGFHYIGEYHAAGDPNGPPPYLRKMRSYNPAGLRYDTSVPALCTASDIELDTRGAAACPQNSRVGSGTVKAAFMGFVSTLHADVFNNTDQQIILLSSPGFASVTRGHIAPDGSVEFAAPTCAPSIDPIPCPVDDALQLGSDITTTPVTKPSAGSIRSYLTTPTTCPTSGQWTIPIRFWWADGSVDTVVTEQPCTRPPSSPLVRAQRRSRHNGRHHHAHHRSVNTRRHRETAA